MSTESFVQLLQRELAQVNEAIRDAVYRAEKAEKAMRYGLRDQDTMNERHTMNLKALEELRERFNNVYVTEEIGTELWQLMESSINHLTAIIASLENEQDALEGLKSKGVTDCSLTNDLRRNDRNSAIDDCIKIVKGE
jgi:hypothetical protein